MRTALGDCDGRALRIEEAIDGWAPRSGRGPPPWLIKIAGRDCTEVHDMLDLFGKEKGRRDRREGRQFEKWIGKYI